MKILPIIPSVYNFDPALIRDQLSDIILSKYINAVHFDNWNDLENYRDLMEKYNIVADIHLLGDNPLNDLAIIIRMKLSCPLRVSMHVESGQDRQQFCKIAKDCGISPGLAFKLKTQVNNDPNFYLGFDYVHLVCNDETAGAPSFQNIVFDKIKCLLDFLPKNLSITIDSGVKEENINSSVQAGVDNMVMGSAIFKSANPLETIVRFNKIVNGNYKI